MSNTYALAAETRTQAGKGVARELRRQKKIPGVIYGEGKEATSISLPEKEVHIEYNKGIMRTTLCDLTVDGKVQKVLARDLQIHPVTDRVEHVDFLRVTNKTRVTLRVPVVFINHETSPGLVAKGSLNVEHHALPMSVFAVDMPEAITVDLNNYKAGQAIKLSSVKLPKGVALADKGRKDITIGYIAEPKIFAAG
jgi:large subunit ribosomal protein L25